MKKILGVFLLFAAIHGVAVGDVLIGTDDERCIVDTHKTNEFWFCGYQDSDYKKNNCHARHVYKGALWFPDNPTHQLYNGDKVTTGGRYFVCCGGTPTAQGRFVESDTSDFRVTQEPKTVDLGDNKKCTYTITTDICGNVTDKPCTEPDSCTNGTLPRNGACVQLCTGTDAFESETSNKCVECSTTSSRGRVVGKDGNMICQVCDSNEFFDTDAKQCVRSPTEDKNTTYTTENEDGTKVTHTYSVISRDAMDRCWLCDDRTKFRACVKAYMADPDSVTAKIACEEGIVSGGAADPVTECKTSDEPRACRVTNGAGRQECVNGFWGQCLATECDDGYTKSGNSCVLANDNGNGNNGTVCTPGDSTDCPIANGKGRKKCLADGSDWGACQVTECNKGFNMSVQFNICLATKGTLDNKTPLEGGTWELSESPVKTFEKVAI